MDRREIPCLELTRVVRGGSGHAADQHRAVLVYQHHRLFGARLYRENRRQLLHFGPGERVRPPLSVAVFPHESPMPPRSWVERVYDVRRWTPMSRGGHFAAMEEPELLAADIRAAFRPFREQR